MTALLSTEQAMTLIEIVTKAELGKKYPVDHPYFEDVKFDGRVYETDGPIEYSWICDGKFPRRIGWQMPTNGELVRTWKRLNSAKKNFLEEAIGQKEIAALLALAED